jgi:hypothetical protein
LIRAQARVAGSQDSSGAVVAQHKAQRRLPGKCRSSLGFLLGSWRDGPWGALQMGAKPGGLVRRVLLGADGVAHRRREDPAVASSEAIERGLELQTGRI